MASVALKSNVQVDSVTEILTTQEASCTEMSKPQPKVQSKMANFSHPLLSTSLSIIAGAELKMDGG